MSGVPSIFDTPLLPQPLSLAGLKRTPPVNAEPEAKRGGKKSKKAAAGSSKKKLIDQLLQEQRRELSQDEDGASVESSPKKGKKKKNAVTSNNEESPTKAETSKSKKNAKNAKSKAKATFKVKLEDAKMHREKLRKSLACLNRSKNAQNDESTVEEAINGGDSLKNSSTPVRKNTKPVAKSPKPFPMPILGTPSKVVIKQEPKTPKANGVSCAEDSTEIGREKFAWVIHPTTVDEFMANYWEKKPLLLQRRDPSYYKNLLSRAKIDEMLRKHNIEYTKNIDVTSYREGQRETHNPDGRVLPLDMWSFYEEGCSIRMLNPQTYLPGVYEMNVKLQEFFHCMTGANFYLTPPNSQGFAPHFDDIEAFVLQVEGRKHWKLYSPREPAEVLARVSSPNFSQDEIGSPILDVVLEPGDLLYFPRGIIHQANTVPGHHSLHVTMSVYQKNCWADLLEVFFPHALAQAAETHFDLRRGIPLDLHHHFGIVNSDNETPTRKQLIGHIKALVDKVFSEEAIDSAVDQLAKRFQHDALPPLVSDKEQSRTIYGSSNFNYNADGTVNLRVPFTEDSTVRLLRRNVLRLVSEEDKLRIYYHTDNSREYHEYEPNFLEVDQDAALGVELLVKMYPQELPIRDLPVEDKVEFAKSLWEKGLIVVLGIKNFTKSVYSPAPRRNKKRGAPPPPPESSESDDSGPDCPPPKRKQKTPERETSVPSVASPAPGTSRPNNWTVRSSTPASDAGRASTDAIEGLRVEDVGLRKEVTTLSGQIQLLHTKVQELVDKQRVADITEPVNQTRVREYPAPSWNIFVDNVEEELNAGRIHEMLSPQIDVSLYDVFMREATAEDFTRLVRGALMTFTSRRPFSFPALNEVQQDCLYAMVAHLEINTGRLPEQDWAALNARLRNQASHLNKMRYLPARVFQRQPGERPAPAAAPEPDAAPDPTAAPEPPIVALVYDGLEERDVPSGDDGGETEVDPLAVPKRKTKKKNKKGKE